jgi:hypothetical protein
MPSITINDLALSEALDRKAMLSVRGGGGEWVIGAFPAFAKPSRGIVPVVNYYQVTNNYTLVDKMVNQFTTIDIDNSGDNANVTAVLINSLGS